MTSVRMIGGCGVQSVRTSYTFLLGLWPAGPVACLRRSNAELSSPPPLYPGTYPPANRAPEAHGALPEPPHNDALLNTVYITKNTLANGTGVESVAALQSVLDAGPNTVFVIRDSAWTIDPVHPQTILVRSDSEGTRRDDSLSRPGKKV